MIDAEKRLWPFSPRTSLVAAVAILIGLPLLLAILHATLDWPSAQSETAVFVGILLLSLLPILLVLLDVVIERGGVIEYRGVKVDFSQSRAVGTAGMTVAPNIGVPGEVVTDSSSVMILDSLRKATTSDVVVIDLEEGQAWWETRLMVLLEGADRLERPEKIVFIGTDAGKEQQFQGWAYTSDLFRRFVDAHPAWAPMVQAARTAAREWELVEPVNTSPDRPPTPPAPPPLLPGPLPWFGPLAQGNAWMAFDPATGRRNELFAEQLLQSEIGREVEQKGGTQGISLVRLEELFRPILMREHVDLSWSADRQVDAVLDLQAPFIAMTQQGKYTSIVSRLTLMNELLKSLVKAQQPK
jgi:hypothetical protein